MKRKGDLVWYQSIGISLTYNSAIFLAFFKEASLFKFKKRFQFMSDFCDSLFK